MRLFSNPLFLWLFLLLSMTCSAQKGIDKGVYEEQREEYNYSDEEPKERTNRTIDNAEPIKRSPQWKGWKGVLTVLGILILVGFVVYLVFNIQKRNDSKATRELIAAKSLKHAEQDLLEVSLDELITGAAKVGDHRMLVHLHYLDLLKALHDQGHILWKPFKTNGQYAFEIDNDGIRNEYSEITRTFDRVWYGHKPISAAELEEWKSSLEKLIKS